MTLLLRVLLSILLCCTAWSAVATDHVRVVLDTSLSMRIALQGGGGRNDPNRLAVLATAMLFDLAHPNTTLGDSFAVIPFDQDWLAWPATDAEPQPSRRPILRAGVGNRAAFLGQLKAIPYDSPMTYFYPVLARALDDLPPPADGHRVRVIILVTDGVPEAETRERELALIRERLLPRLSAAKVQLYVLAFGNDALRYRAFFDQLLAAAGGDRPAGGLIPAQGAADLLDGMVQIFTRSFGYRADEAQPVSALPGLDLAGGVSPERAIALVMGTVRNPTARDAPAPALRLTPPTGALLNAPDGALTAAVPGGAYTLLHVLNPEPGRYGLTSDGSGAVAAVLRPTRLALRVLPARAGDETGRAMVGRPLDLRVRVAPASGGGDPGPVGLSFRLLGERLTAADGTTGHAFVGDALPPVDNVGEPGAEGRDYRIIATFPAHGADHRRPYLGYIELRAYRGEALVGELTGDQAHPVRIEPPGSVFRTSGVTVPLDFGPLSLGAQRCLPFDPAAEHYGEVALKLTTTHALPQGFTLWVRLPREEIRLAGPAVASLPGDRYELCLRVAEDARTSRLTDDDRLRLQVAGTTAPEQGVGMRVSWEVQGLSLWQAFWRHWWRWIAGALVATVLATLVGGFIAAPRFPPKLALVYVARQDELQQSTAVALKNYRGTGAGWFRPARAYLHTDFKVSGRGRGALAGLVAKGRTVMVVPLAADLFYELDADDWIAVGSAGRQARAGGEAYRIGSRGPFFRLALRGAS
jgi:hypothetical protein